MSEATPSAGGGDRRNTLRHRHPAVRVRLADDWLWSADWSATGVSVHLPADCAEADAITARKAVRFDGALSLADTGPARDCSFRVARWAKLNGDVLCVGLAYEDEAGAMADFLADWTLTKALRAGYQPHKVDQAI